MQFLKVTSPHTSKQGQAGNVMLSVIYATIPGIIALTYFFGVGILINLILATIFGLGLEALILYMRKRDITFYLKDYSALVTAFLLGLALPAYAPWWLIAVGMFFSIVIAKQLYGGLGFNPFNPAMIGYVVLLISFPLEMSSWTTPAPLNGGELPSLSAALAKVFLGHELAIEGALLDGYTSATPLELMRQNDGQLVDQLYSDTPLFSEALFAGVGWEWVNIAFLIGGVYLMYKRVFTWHAPISMLVALGVLAAVFYDGGSSASLGSPLFHWLTGATMFGAFFIITDPVSSAVSNRGRIVFGALIGVLIFVIRSFSNYPDGVAFAVLLLNFAAPFIDYYTKPRTYGHKSKSKG